MANRDSFSPFDDAQSRSDNDFHVDDLASHLELNNLQKRLLVHWLRGLELKIWFTDDGHETNPRLVIAVFGGDIEGTQAFVADVNLSLLFKGCILEEEFSQIGDEPEIQALEEFKAEIEAAITARKPGIEGDQQEENAEGQA